jgi:hypothetical protein
MVEWMSKEGAGFFSPRKTKEKRRIRRWVPIPQKDLHVIRFGR